MGSSVRITCARSFCPNLTRSRLPLPRVADTRSMTRWACLVALTGVIAAAVDSLALDATLREEGGILRGLLAAPATVGLGAAPAPGGPLPAVVHRKGRKAGEPQ